MAEQDRKDLVPAVLNDLIDVDGTPAEGDTLTFRNGAWRPAVADNLLSRPNGPAVQEWTFGLGEGSDTYDVYLTEPNMDNFATQ
jgi:hypothetical protein